MEKESREFSVENEEQDDRNKIGEELKILTDIPTKIKDVRYCIFELENSISIT